MRRNRMKLLVSMVVVAGASAAFAAGGCANPVIDDEIAALGPDLTRPGPDHRPGQPCLLCHEGVTAPDFAIAGTVYATPDSKVAVEHATVIVTDANGRKFKKSTNCAGNFYGDTAEPLAYPLRAEVLCTLPDGSSRRSVMGTRIDRTGSCADCHVGNPTTKSPGRVACDSVMPDPPFESPGQCGDDR